MRLSRIVFMALAVSGCASATHGTKQRVMVSTPGAPKAECRLTSKSLGTQRFLTPEAVEIPRSSEAIEISCHKKCFYDETKTFNSSINAEDLASNGFFVGFAGAAPIAIDLATKKAYNYTYDFVVQMKPDHRCRSKRKGFLDGDPKDFDNRIQDFSFDDNPAPLPDPAPEDMKNTPQPPEAQEKKVK